MSDLIYEKLLVHGDFIRSLARSLIRDPQGADDIVQDTYLAALKNPPDPEKPIKPWLSTVIRNFVGLSRRSQWRRLQREQSWARPVKLRSTQEVVEKESMRKRIISAVLELKEPYRSAILYKFYDNLPPRKIAKQLCLPTETVRTHVSRGLSLLRDKLDRDFGFQRENWLAAVYPLAGLKMTASAKPLWGMLMMGIQTKMLLSVFVLLGLIFGTFVILPEKENDDRLIKDSINNPPISNEERVPGKGPIKTSPEEDAVQPLMAEIKGLVFDRITGIPEPVFEVVLEEKKEQGHFINKVVRHKEGAFCFNIYKDASYQLIVNSSRHLPKVFKEIQNPTNLKIPLDLGPWVSGQAIEESTGRPVSNAVVTIGLYYEKGSSERGFIKGRAYTITDHQGRFTLGRFQNKETKLWVFHEGFAPASKFVNPSVNEEVLFQLKKGYCIYGKVKNDLGQPCSGVIIKTSGFSVTPKRDGSYRTYPLIPGKIRLFSDPKGFDLKEVLSQHYTCEDKIVYLTDHDLEVNFGPSSPEWVNWKGVLYDNKQPCNNVELTIKRDPDCPWPSVRFYKRSIRTDHSGRFMVAKLCPGGYQVRAHLKGESRISLGTVFFDKPGVIKKDIQLPRGAISGMVVDSSTGHPIGRNPHTDQKLRVKARNIATGIVSSMECEEDGSFCFNRLEKGAYSLYLFTDQDMKTDVEINSRAVTGLRLVLPAKGRLWIKGMGFQKKFGLYLDRSGERTRQSKNPITLKPNDQGDVDEITLLDPGLWTAVFSFKGQGLIRFPIEIKANQETVLPISNRNLAFYPGTVSLTGVLSDVDGAPLPNASLTFQGVRVPTRKSDEWYIKETVTKKQGVYEMQKMRPGRWSVYATLSSGQSVPFHDLVIPPFPSDPHTMDFRLPSGSILGSFNTHMESWEAMVEDVNTKRKVKSKGENSASFYIHHIKKGEYRLVVNVLGYQRFESEPFYFSENKILNWGMVTLKPCGVLDLITGFNVMSWEAMSYELFCNNKKQKHVKVIRTEGLNPETVYRFHNLPLGEVFIKIKGLYYKDTDLKVKLKPGEITLVRVKMEMDR